LIDKIYLYFIVHITNFEGHQTRFVDRNVLHPSHMYSNVVIPVIIFILDNHSDQGYIAFGQIYKSTRETLWNPLDSCVCELDHFSL